MEKVNKVLQLIAKAGAIFAGLCVFAMMFLVTADVLGRTLFASPIKGSYAIVQNILMPCSFFTALPMCFIAGILPKVEGPLKKAPEIVRKINTIIIMIVEVAMMAMMLYGGYNFCKTGFVERLGVDMDGTVVRIYPMYLILPVGFLITLVCVLLEYKKAEKTQEKAEEAEE